MSLQQWNLLKDFGAKLYYTVLLSFVSTTSFFCVHTYEDFQEFKSRSIKHDVALQRHNDQIAEIARKVNIRFENQNTNER